MVKVLYLLFAGPEMPCKLQHAFVFARDVRERHGEAALVFEGNAPRWLLEIGAPGHSLYGAFSRAKEEGALHGVCKACAAANGALEAAERLGLRLLSDASGHVSLAPYLEGGWEIVTL